MARLTKLPEQHIIDGFKGVIDFYEWKGIPCARKWPTWRRREPTPAEAQAQQTFAYINQALGTSPQYIRDSFTRMAAGLPWTWRDLAVRAYISGLSF